MENSVVIPSPAASMSLVVRGRPALEHLRPSMLAIEPTRLRTINVDIALAVSRALGVAPAVAANRARIVSEMPMIDVHAIDEIEERALALACVNADYESAVAPVEGFQEIMAEVFQSRTALLAVARGLIACNHLSEACVVGLNGGHGYHEATDDLLALVAVFVRNWAALEGKLPITRVQLDHTQASGERALEMLGIREQTPAHVSEELDLRVRAFTLLDEAYDELRRAMAYLRWREGDAEAIVPSLRQRPAGTHTADKPAADAKNIAAPAAPAASPAPAGPAPSGLPRSAPFTA